MICGDRYYPEGAFMPEARQRRPGADIFGPIAPAWVLEMDFATKYSNPIYPAMKIANYLAAGTVVWSVNLQRERVEVYAPGEPVRIFGPDDTLDGGEIFPGLALPVKDIFRK